MNEIKNKSSEDDFQKTLFLFDNAKFHTFLQTEKFLKDIKFKIFTIVPYMSPLDSFELSFGFIKNILYKRLFTSISHVNEMVKSIIESREFKISLEKQFKETLEYNLKNL